MTINRNELMKAGARARLVEIERERIELLRIFPDLDELRADAAAAPKKRRKQTKKTTRKQKKQKLRAKAGTQLQKLGVLVTKHEQLTSADVSNLMRISRDRASNLLNVAKTKGMVARIKHGVYGAPS